MNTSDIWFVAFGWLGSILVVASLIQARVLRFRWMNLAGAFVSMIYNAAIGVWPFAVMNAVITVIDIYWIRKLYQEAGDPEVYQVLSVPTDDPYLAQVLAVHAKDIAKFEPKFALTPSGSKQSAFLVVRGDEAVGVVALRESDPGVGVVELDWVKPRFRDFTVGQFVYADSTALPDAGFKRVEVHAHEGSDRDYLQKAGFHAQGDTWVRELAA